MLISQGPAKEEVGQLRSAYVAILVRTIPDKNVQAILAACAALVVTSIPLP